MRLGSLGGGPRRLGSFARSGGALGSSSGRPFIGAATAAAATPAAATAPPPDPTVQALSYLQGAAGDLPSIPSSTAFANAAGLEQPQQQLVMVQMQQLQHMQIAQQLQQFAASHQPAPITTTATPATATEVAAGPTTCMRHTGNSSLAAPQSELPLRPPSSSSGRPKRVRFDEVPRVYVVQQPDSHQLDPADAAYEAAAWDCDDDDDDDAGEEGEGGEGAAGGKQSKAERAAAKRRRLGEKGEGQALRRHPQAAAGASDDADEEEQQEQQTRGGLDEQQAQAAAPPLVGLAGGLRGFNAGRRRLARAVQAALRERQESGSDDDRGGEGIINGGGTSSGDEDGGKDEAVHGAERAALEAEAGRIAAIKVQRGKGAKVGAAAAASNHRGRQALPDERLVEGTPEAAAMQSMLEEVRGLLVWCGVVWCGVASCALGGGMKPGRAGWVAKSITPTWPHLPVDDVSRHSLFEPTGGIPSSQCGGADAHPVPCQACRPLQSHAGACTALRRTGCALLTPQHAALDQALPPAARPQDVQPAAED